MDYEKIPHDKNKSIKLKYHDIEAVHWLFHVEKWKVPQIADRFNVSNYCIIYHLLSDEKRKEYNIKCAEYNKARLLHDKNYKYHIRRRQYEWEKENNKNRPDRRLYNSYVDKKYKQKPEVKSRIHEQTKQAWQNLKNNPILLKKHNEQLRFYYHRKKSIL